MVNSWATSGIKLSFWFDNMVNLLSHFKTTDTQWNRWYVLMMESLLFLVILLPRARIREGVKQFVLSVCQRFVSSVKILNIDRFKRFPKLTVALKLWKKVTYVYLIGSKAVLYLCFSSSLTSWWSVILLRSIPWILNGFQNWQYHWNCEKSDLCVPHRKQSGSVLLLFQQFNVVMIRHFITVNTLDIVESGCLRTWRMSIILRIRWSPGIICAVVPILRREDTRTKWYHLHLRATFFHNNTMKQREVCLHWLRLLAHACASSISTYCPLHVEQPCSYWSSGRF